MNTKQCDLYEIRFHKHKYLTFKCSSDVPLLSRLCRTDFYTVLKLFTLFKLCASKFYPIQSFKLLTLCIPYCTKNEVFH